MTTKELCPDCGGNLPLCTCAYFEFCAQGGPCDEYCESCDEWYRGEGEPCPTCGEEARS